MQPFARPGLLKFVGLEDKYNPDYVKSFNCKMVVTPAGIEIRFKDRIFKFTYFDFTKYLGMTFDGVDIDVRFPE